MKPEVVRDFLNVPGIAGIALIDPAASAHFCSTDPQLRFEKTELLSQGLLKILETTPDTFTSLELQFPHYQIHLNRLEPYFIFLVLAHRHLNLAHPTYRSCFSALCQGIQAAPEDAIVQLRHITEDFLAEDNLPTQINPPIPPSPHSPSPDRTDTPAERLHPAHPCLQEFLTAFNHLGAIATQYLGNAIIANHLLRTRPTHPWLKQFSIDRQGRIMLSGNTGLLDQPVTPEEAHLLRQWASTFTTKCSQVIRDFATLASQQGLQESEKSLLLD